MGLGGDFWKIVAPTAEVYSTVEGLRRLRGKRLAVDLSYWICQFDGTTRLGGKTTSLHRNLKPHLRNLFFRTIKLAARIGALPVFVIDGDPPPLKLQARIKRFCKMTGISFPMREAKVLEGVQGNRNRSFLEKVEQCVKLLRLLGMPVLVAPGEAEALCAKLNKRGLVDYCVSSDSDTFLHGASRVIAKLHIDFRAPLVEEYSAEAIARLGLKQKHLVALALLLGCDYSKGVHGVGRRQALRLVRTCSEDKVLSRLGEWANSKFPDNAEMSSSLDLGSDSVSNSDLGKDRKPPHCSRCGCPGTLKEHGKACKPKEKDFSCSCVFCFQVRKAKKTLQRESWWRKACEKMGATEGFPSQGVVDAYLETDAESFTDQEQLKQALKWDPPDVEHLKEFLKDVLSFPPDYTHQKILPLVSHTCLTNMAAGGGLSSSTLYPSWTIGGVYIPVGIKGKKKEYGETLLILCWAAASSEVDATEEKNRKCFVKRMFESTCNMLEMAREMKDVAGDAGGGSNYESFTTVENESLVQAACPRLWAEFNRKQMEKEKQRKNCRRERKSSSSNKGQQSRIGSFFKVKKKGVAEEQVEEKVTPSNAESGREGPHFEGTLSQKLAVTHANIYWNRAGESESRMKEEREGESVDYSLVTSFKGSDEACGALELQKEVGINEVETVSSTAKKTRRVFDARFGNGESFFVHDSPRMPNLDVKELDHRSRELSSRAIVGLRYPVQVISPLEGRDSAGRSRAEGRPVKRKLDMRDGAASDGDAALMGSQADIRREPERRRRGASINDYFGPLSSVGKSTVVEGKQEIAYVILSSDSEVGEDAPAV